MSEVDKVSVKLFEELQVTNISVFPGENPVTAEQLASQLNKVILQVETGEVDYVSFEDTE